MLTWSAITLVAKEVNMARLDKTKTAIASIHHFTEAEVSSLPSEQS